MMKCLILIAFMEAWGQSSATQRMVMDVALNRAASEATDICVSMKKPKAYSWMWDGKNTKVNEKGFEEVKKATKMKPILSNKYLYFNECKLGRRFKTNAKLIKSGVLCFY